MRQALLLSFANAVAVLILTLLVCTQVAAAPVYQWLDEEGRPVFSDQPPTGHAAERLELQVEQPDEAAIQEAQRVHQERVEINQSMEAERKAREAAIAEQRAMQQAIREAQRLKALEEQREREQEEANQRHYYAPVYPYYPRPCVNPGSYWRCQDDRYQYHPRKYHHDKRERAPKEWDNNPRAGWFDRDRRMRP